MCRLLSGANHFHQKRDQRFLCSSSFLVFSPLVHPQTHSFIISLSSSWSLAGSLYSAQTRRRTDGWKVLVGGRIDERVKVKLGSTYYYYYRRVGLEQQSRAEQSGAEREYGRLGPGDLCVRREKTHHHHDVYMCIVYQKPGARSEESFVWDADGSSQEHGSQSTTHTSARWANIWMYTNCVCVCVCPASFWRWGGSRVCVEQRLSLHWQPDWHVCWYTVRYIIMACGVVVVV